MAIDIKGITGNSLAPKKVGNQGAAKRKTATSGPEAAGDEQVSITQTAMSLENVERLMAQIPVVDANRVETVRESLSKGTYDVDPERTAEKFIRFELMLSRAVVEHANT